MLEVWRKRRRHLYLEERGAGVRVWYVCMFFFSWFGFFFWYRVLYHENEMTGLAGMDGWMDVDVDGDVDGDVEGREEMQRILDMFMMMMMMMAGRWWSVVMETETRWRAYDGVRYDALKFT
jgi:hypothetical protein